MPPRQNSKSEARNPKQCQMSQIRNSKRASLQSMQFRDWEIRILNLFRISKFELRISKGKLDHLVNFVVTKKTQLTKATETICQFSGRPPIVRPLTPRLWTPSVRDRRSKRPASPVLFLSREQAPLRPGPRASRRRADA